MNKTQVVTSGGGGCMGFASLLTILFVALKLMGYINWSWLWVVSPLWIGFGLTVLFVIVAVLIFIILASKYA